MKIDAALARIEFVKDAVVANAQLELGSARQSLVRESGEMQTHFIHLALHVLLNGLRQGIKGF